MNMVFSLNYLKFTADNQLQHLELFAGDCSVTRGEYSDMGRKNMLYVQNGGPTLGYHYFYIFHVASFL